MAKWRKLGFFLLGDNTTRLIRDLWEERSCLKAYEVCKAGMEMPDNLIIDLIEGKRHLVGDTREGDHTLALQKDNSGYTGTSVRKMADILFSEMKNYVGVEKEWYSENKYGLSNSELTICLKELEKKVQKYHDTILLLCKLSGIEESVLEEEYSMRKRENSLRCLIIKSKFPMDGWISPEGLFYVVAVWGHREFSERWYPIKDNSEYSMEEEGWLKLSSGAFRLYVSKITRAQKEFLFDYVMEHRGVLRFNGETYPSMDEVLAQYYE